MLNQGKGAQNSNTPLISLPVWRNRRTLKWSLWHRLAELVWCDAMECLWIFQFHRAQSNQNCKRFSSLLPSSSPTPIFIPPVWSPYKYRENMTSFLVSFLGFSLPYSFVHGSGRFHTCEFSHTHLWLHNYRMKWLLACSKDITRSFSLPQIHSSMEQVGSFSCIKWSRVEELCGLCEPAQGEQYFSPYADCVSFTIEYWPAKL